MGVISDVAEGRGMTNQSEGETMRKDFAELRNSISRVELQGAPGRDPKFTAHTQEILIRLVEDGMPLEHAGAMVGVHPERVRGWLRAGEIDEDGPFGPFNRGVAQGRALCQLRLLEAIDKAEDDDKDWRAPFALLERLFPETWGPDVDDEDELEKANPMGRSRSKERDTIVKGRIHGSDDRSHLTVVNGDGGSEEGSNKGPES